MAGGAGCGCIDTGHGNYVGCRAIVFCLANFQRVYLGTMKVARWFGVEAT